MTIKVAINGACGKMGKEIFNQAKNFEEIEISALIEHQNHNKIGQKYDKTLNLTLQSFKTLNLENIEIIIDFSTDSGLNTALDFALHYNIPIISGTTGLSEKTIKKMKETSQKIPILHSSNMSLGINILSILLEQTSKLTTEEFETEIIEKHHSQKKDSPSGTALMLGKILAKAKNLNFDKVANFQRNGQNIERKKDEIGFSSVRAGGIFGEHTILFASKDETIELSHTAFNRKIFASGALKAAKWLKAQKNGFYSMRDFLSS